MHGELEVDFRDFNHETETSTLVGLEQNSTDRYACNELYLKIKDLWIHLALGIH